MPITLQEVEERIATLEAKTCSRDFVFKYYGIPMEVQENIFEKANQWAQSRRRRTVLSPDGGVDRSTFEIFLHAFNRLPRKWAAARLGMNVISFDNTVERLLAYNPMLSLESEVVTHPLVSEEFVKKFHRYFRSTEYEIFQNHSARCFRIHQAIRNELGIEIDALFCETSRRVDPEDDWDYAYEFDCLTLRPVGLKNQIWLDTGKPMMLHPDVTSQLTFAAFPDTIAPIVFGGQPPQLAHGVQEAAERWVQEM